MTLRSPRSWRQGLDDAWAGAVVMVMAAAAVLGLMAIALYLG